MKKLLTLLFIGLLAGCSNNTSDLPYADYLNKSNPEVIFDLNGRGEITIQLFPEIAPNTVNNFLELAQDGFYDNTMFYQIYDEVVLGGDTNGDGTGRADNAIPGEFASNYVENDLSHVRGIVSMLRTYTYDSASSQFFIVHKDRTDLDGNYAAFGGIVDGFDTLDKIATAEKNDANFPVEEIYIKSVTIELNDYVMKDTEYTEPLSTDFFLPGEYRNEDNPQVMITFANEQTITLELFAEEAPHTVDNFLALIEEGFYDGLTMHRIIEGFMIQGGDPNGNGTGGSDEDIKGEFKANGVNNEISHVRGVLSMARSNDPNSASSQFFIVHKDSTFLDGEYAAFGAIVTGFETLDYIASVEVDGTDKPVEDIVITSIERIR